jgi:hypothetical protein
VQINKQIKALGIYQICGAAMGIVFIGIVLFKLPFTQSLLYLVFLLGLALYSYSLYGGIILVQQKEKGLDHSIISQIFQLFYVSIQGYAFQYVSGIFLTIGADVTHSFVFSLNLGISYI